MSLRYAADRRTIAFISAYFIVLAVAYSLPLSWWTTPFLVGLLSLISFICAVITHNTVHAPMFHARGMNRLVQVVLTLTYGHPVSAFVPGHNLSHHRHTQTERDLMRTSKLRFRWNFLNQLLFAWTVGPSVFQSNWRFAREMRTRKPAWFRQLCLEAAIFIGFVLVAFVIDWQKALLFVLIPHQYAAWGVVGINFMQHDGCDPKSPWNHSRNFTGFWTNWLTFNNGYHGIHHMKPSLHWSLLPEVHRRELAPHIHPALEEPNLVGYAFRAFVWPGRRLTYDGRPYDPPPAGVDGDWFGRGQGLRSSDLGASG